MAVFGNHTTKHGQEKSLGTLAPLTYIRLCKQLPLTLAAPVHGRVRILVHFIIESDKLYFIVL